MSRQKTRSVKTARRRAAETIVGTVRAVARPLVDDRLDGGIFIVAPDPERFPHLVANHAK
jgi:hypothetical protein